MLISQKKTIDRAVYLDNARTTIIFTASQSIQRSKYLQVLSLSLFSTDFEKQAIQEQDCEYCQHN